MTLSQVKWLYTTFIRLITTFWIWISFWYRSHLPLGTLQLFSSGLCQFSVTLMNENHILCSGTKTPVALHYSQDLETVRTQLKAAPITGEETHCCLSLFCYVGSKVYGTRSPKQLSPSIEMFSPRGSTCIHTLEKILFPVKMWLCQGTIKCMYTWTALNVYFTQWVEEGPIFRDTFLCWYSCLIKFHNSPFVSTYNSPNHIDHNGTSFQTNTHWIVPTATTPFCQGCNPAWELRLKDQAQTIRFTGPGEPLWAVCITWTCWASSCRVTRCWESWTTDSGTQMYNTGIAWSPALGAMPREVLFFFFLPSATFPPLQEGAPTVEGTG